MKASAHSHHEVVHELLESGAYANEKNVVGR